jgi:hypothetical protein
MATKRFILLLLLYNKFSQQGGKKVTIVLLPTQTVIVAHAV